MAKALSFHTASHGPPIEGAIEGTGMRTESTGVATAIPMTVARGWSLLLTSLTLVTVGMGCQGTGATTPNGSLPKGEAAPFVLQTTDGALQASEQLLIFPGDLASLPEEFAQEWLPQLGKSATELGIGVVAVTEEELPEGITATPAFRVSELSWALGVPRGVGMRSIDFVVSY